MKKETLLSGLADCYVKALLFAAEAHHAVDQQVPGTDLPYICHPVSVAAEVLVALHEAPAARGDLAVACALLHDTIEDTKVTYDQIDRAFGRAVAEGVAALSKDQAVGNGNDDYYERKRAMMNDSLARIRQQPHEVWMVKLADRITNLSSPPHYWDDEKRRRYREEAGIILEALAPACDFLAQRLAKRIELYGQFITT